MPPKLDPVMVTDVPTGPETGFKLAILGGGVMVKRTPLLATPPTVTTTFPVVAPAGTWTVILTELQAVGATEPTDVPLNVTVLVPWDEPKFAPDMRIKAPTAPDEGLRLVMLGAGGITVKLTPLLATPLRVTTTVPVVAPAGTVTLTLVSLQVETDATVPLNVTMLVPWVAPKLVPVTVTAVPVIPDVGLKLVMFGGGITVKVTPLLEDPLFVVATTGPVVAPLGTNATMLVLLQLVIPIGLPLSVTVPSAAPKFAPAIVTDAPYRPLVGVRLLIFGGGEVTVKVTPLLTTLPTVTVTATLPLGAPVGTGATMLV